MCTGAPRTAASETSMETIVQLKASVEEGESICCENLCCHSMMLCCPPGQPLSKMQAAR